MSCRTTYAGSAMTAIARYSTNNMLSDVAVLSIFHELRRDYRESPRHIGINASVAWSRFLDSQINQVRGLRVSQARRDSIIRRLQSARSEPIPEASILYAIENIENKVYSRSRKVNQFCESIASRMNLPIADIQAQFTALSHTDETRRRSRLEFTQTNIDLANRFGLGSDFGMLNAVSVLNDQARAIEATQIRTGVPRITRKTITDPAQQETGLSNLLLTEYGYDLRNRRLEIVILDTDTGLSKVHAYDFEGKNYSSKYFQGIENVRGGIGNFWYSNIRGHGFEYVSEEADKKASVAPNCTTCGQFSTADHTCPTRNEPAVLSFDSTVSLWSNQLVGPNTGWNPIRVNLPPIREFKQALLTGAVKVEGIMYGDYRKHVEGSLLAFLDEEGNLKVSASQLYCTCGGQLNEQEMINGYCTHISNVVEATKIRLGPAAEAYKSKSQAKRDEMVAKAQAKLLAEEEIRKQALFVNDWMKSEVTAEEARKNWISESEVLYSQDFSAFQSDYDAAVAKRKELGRVELPYEKENVLNSFATRASGQGFGVELEYSFPPNITGEARKTLQTRIGEELFAAGLTSGKEMVGYHSAKSAGYKDTHVDADGKGTWSWEQDGSVSGELVTPTMYDEPETWEKLEQAIEILTRNGAVASTSAGSHIHVGTGFYNGSVEKYSELARLMTQHEDVLYRLASNPERGTHRLSSYVNPIPAVPNSGFTNISTTRVATGRGALNYAHVTGTDTDHPEFRIFDSTLNPGAVQAQIKLAVAMTHAAVRQAEKGGTARKKEELGAHVARAKALGDEVVSLEEDSDTLRSLLDTLFTRHKDKAHLTAIFANTKWNNAMETHKKTRRRPRSAGYSN